MIDNGYIFAIDNKRIFINTSLGCCSKCSYCYLPEVGFRNDLNNYKVLSFEEIIDLLDKSNVDINKDTLITLGCYSECFDENNKKETIKLVKYFLKKGNQVQLSTKRQIFDEDVKEIISDITYSGQLIIFVSSATISMQKTIEKKTTSIEKRFENFSLYNKFNIPIVLYMKPVLKNITIKDLNLYKEYIKKYNIKDVVVGSVFTNVKSLETIHFSKENKLFYNECDDEDIIISELMNLTNVYRRSSEVMEKYKLKK